MRCFYKQPAINRWVSGVTAVISFELYLRSLRTYSCPASYIVKLKQGAKSLSLYTGSLAWTTFSQAIFEIADYNTHIPTLAAIREPAGAERFVKSVSLPVFTSDARSQRLIQCHNNDFIVFLLFPICFAVFRS